MIKRTLLLCMALQLAVIAGAQKTNEQLGGVYYAYHAFDVDAFASLPEGYTPFYISHYGRHGSRWLPSDSRYEWVLAHFADASNLTRKGRDVARRLQKVWDNARGNGGRLTPVGVRQQQALAGRMAQRFAAMLGKDVRVEARSSVVDRCRRSMEAFVGELRTQRPEASIVMTTDSADMAWMSYDSPDEMLLQMETRATLGAKPDRLMATLFKDPSKVKGQERLFTELHTIATDMQDVDGVKVSLFDLFTRSEMEAIYRYNCARMWHQNGTGAESRDIPAQCAARLWQNIVAGADSAIAHGSPAATLRFGHDTGLYRLLSLLRALPQPLVMGGETVDGPLDEIVPMAANLQMVFCHDRMGEVMVGCWLNEQPVALGGVTAVVRYNGQQWYRWADVKAQYAGYLHRQQWMERTRGINTMVGTDYALPEYWKGLARPFGGSYGKGSEEHGQTIPAVLEPHGMNFWTPQTQDTELKCVAPYYYRDSLFQGFRNSHWLVGGCTQDYGSFTLMPMTGRLRLKPTARATRFSHDDEISHPYYYALYLPDEHLMTEMTGRSRSAIFRVMPDLDGEVHIVVNPNSDEGEGFVTVDTARNCIWGYNPVHRIYQGWGERAGFCGWYVVQFQRPIRSFGVTDTVAYVTLDAQAGEQILFKAASSFTDLEGAWRNMSEIEDWDFLGTRLALDSIWQRQLQRVEVESADEKKVNQLYGALYRASFLPHAVSDVDGRRPRFALGKTLQGGSGVIADQGRRTSYSDFSMWDIYRAQLPLLNIIDPARTADMMQSLVNMYNEGGWMPIFPCWNSYTAAMIGDHAASVLADSYVKNGATFDVEKGYEGVRKNAFETPRSHEEYEDGMGRRALKSYLRYGYIPLEDSVMEAFHTHEQVSRTLEYAYDDFCAAQLAKAWGRAADYEMLMARSGNWRNVINPRTGWADGRYRNGRWLNNQDLTSRVPFITEGAVMHYSFYVPHDVYGLMEAMGGREQFAAKLDTLFGIASPSPSGEGWGGARGGALLGGTSFYWHGNEPCHQIPYLYAWAGEPWKMQALVHQILKTEYVEAPGGLSGNDDAGQMSAWYVFSALGFYPVCPATPYYILGTPSFRRARIGRLVIEAPQVSDDNIYIQQATWNGQPYTRSYITHEMVSQGGTLHLVMGPRPNKAWGSGAADLLPATK